jgi:hypothetical protein
MQATARRLSVVSATSTPRRRLIRVVRPRTESIVMTRIEALRLDIAAHIDREAPQVDGREEAVSVSGRFKVTVQPYATKNTDRNWGVAEIVISEVASCEELHRYIRGDDRIFYSWARVGGDEFLLCSEDLEGQSVYCPTKRLFASHASDDDTFIWCIFHPSPSGRFLAVEGCYWGCSYMVIIYDFSDPLSLPLPKVIECYDAHNVDFDAWVSEYSFRLKSTWRGELVHTIHAADL